MTYRPKLLTVPEGGAGAVSHNAYGLLCGGTTSTGALQSISSLGSAGDVYTSAGAGALGSFQAPAGGGIGFAYYVGFASQSLTDATTYYFRVGTSLVTTQSSSTRIYIPNAGTLTKCYVQIGGTNGTNESATLNIRLNNSSDNLVSNAITFNSLPASFSNTSMSVSVAQGDYIEFKMLTPTWATNPTSVRMGICAYIE